jgi:hypothetical protein
MPDAAQPLLRPQVMGERMRVTVDKESAMFVDIIKRGDVHL